MNITQFTAAIGKPMTINQTPEQEPGWQCQFTHWAEVKREAGSHIPVGVGRTPNEAVADFNKNIAGKEIVFRSRDSEDQTVHVPTDLE